MHGLLFFFTIINLTCLLSFSNSNPLSIVLPLPSTIPTTIENEQVQESNDAYVNENRTLLRREEKEESLSARDASLPLNSMCKNEELDSVEWLTDRVLKLDIIDFNEDMEINSDDSDDDLV